ncbi:UNVERIFIED_CONTAM: putative mitochondrial protein [Sesamum angustifolium]|uniref:Mitochondrial protein n=1 Tax=Sesamum angustifolium TaxID=2727405 RepID=A0AAW2QTK4_9LAMI
MSCLSLNCQGFRGPWTIHHLRELVRRHNPPLVFLIETKCDNRRMVSIKRNLDMFGFSVAARGKSGGIVLLWNKEIYVDLASFSSSHIDARVRLSEESEPWRLTDFYGAPDANNHGESWTLLRYLSQESKLPWMCVGDFNVILLDLEKDGALPTRQWQLRAFREALIDCDLHDLSFLGFPFTWANNREYPHTCIYSDHAPILVEHTQKQKSRQVRTNKPLKFKAMWIKSEDCEKVISRLWHNTSLGDPNDTFMQKLDTCRMGLISWSKVEFGEMTKRIREIEKEIGHIKSSIMIVNAKNKISTLEGELHKLLSAEELKWKQRGKSAWLAEGEGVMRVMSIKLDMSKAYNRIEWKYLEGILSKLGFHYEVVSLIMRCVSSVSYSFLLNESQFGFLSPGMGIRQVFGSNTPQDTRNGLASALGIRIDARPTKYLGLPFLIGRNKREIFSIIRERVWQRIGGWKEKLLSQGDKKKIHWISWDKMCRTKKDGGMGFRKLHAFNLAMLAKQGWRILNNPDLLVSQILKARYFLNDEFLNVKKRSNISFTWRSILDARPVIERGVQWRIGDGRKVRAWKDPWIPRLLFQLLPVNLEGKSRRAAHQRQGGISSGNPEYQTKSGYSCGVYALSHLPWGVISERHNRVADWVKHVLSQLEHDDFNLFVMIYWQLWGRRNKRTMENIDFHPGECVVSAINILRDFYNVVSTKPSLSPSADRWLVPEVEIVKINSDASILRNREGAGLGAIAHDHSGRCIAWRMAFVPNVANPELGETARLAIEIWRCFQWHNCIIEGDCIQIVHKLNSKETDY